jgi:hypothetical protein
MSEPDREAIYLKLRSLIEEMPNLRMAVTEDTYRWLGRIALLIDRSHTSLSKMMFPEISKEKIAAYEELWAEASPLA